MDAPDISVIVPTLNEAANLTPLMERINAALSGRRYEVLIVDDNSHDNTPQICEALAKNFPLRLLVRTAPRDGLSGAVLFGMAEARGEILVVMDADLQHPPERLPELIAAIERGADFAVGSRYVKGGSIESGWTFFRAINSWVATALARPFAGRVSDPMSGFLALRRASYQSARRLTPLGYKIGLELLCKTRAQNVQEIPIHFGKRQAGESKLNLREQFRYLEHLSRLYDFSFPRLSPIVKFLIVTILSWSLAACYYVATRSIGWRPVGSLIIAYGLVVAVTAVFHARYVRTQREFLVHRRPWIDFLLSAACEWTACAVVAWYLISRAGVHREAEVFLISFIAALFVRYVLRKELLLDVRGLRHEIRKDEMHP
ncbi:MAG: glycosyltransferase [Burkholderiales bacterium]|nr:glycosyltransferase [Phycisphaerae bacterium]